MILPFVMVVLGVSVLMGLLWLLFGRDVPPASEISATFPPPFPAWAAGILVDEHLDGVDWLALILEMARKGAFRLERTPEGGMRVRCIPERSPEDPAERALFQVICAQGEVSLDAPLSSRDFLPAAEALYDALTRKGFFAHNPWRVRRLFRDFGNILMGAGILGALVGVAWGMIPAWIGLSLGLVPAGLVVRTMGEHMPRKTARGSEAVEILYALQRSLHEGLPGNPEEVLPYALVLGMVGEVIDRMDRLPDWWPGEKPLDLTLLARNLPAFG